MTDKDKGGNVTRLPRSREATVSLAFTVPKSLERPLHAFIGETMRGDYSRLEKYEKTWADQADAGAAALRVICTAIRQNPTTGQVRRLTRFLACLYNGPRFPFDLTELRDLDTKLADACLAVLEQDRRGVSEIHNWGVVDADELNKWVQDDGLYYEAQRRRIAAELYEAKYPSGHKDEGMQA